MDVFSHFALPFLLVYAITRHRPAALAAGVGGFAPDLDSFTFPLSYWDPVYFLGHRGLSHSLVGAPLFALGAVLLLRARFWSRVLPLARELRFPPRLVLVALAFSFTHLLLDWTTMWGVPLLYPWTPARWSVDWFFYSVTFMIPFSAYFVWRVARGSATERTYRVVGALLLAALVVASGIRAVTRPDHMEADVVQPAAGEWAWTTLRRDDDKGWQATFWSWGRMTGERDYANALPADPGASDALARARAHPEYRAFQLYARGPEVVQVEAREDGGWNVTFLDLTERTQADRAPWIPWFAEAGVLKLIVHGERVEEET